MTVASTLFRLFIVSARHNKIDECAFECTEQTINAS